MLMAMVLRCIVVFSCPGWSQWTEEVLYLDYAVHI